MKTKQLQTPFLVEKMELRSLVVVESFTFQPWMQRGSSGSKGPSCDVISVWYSVLSLLLLVWFAIQIRYWNISPAASLQHQHVPITTKLCMKKSHCNIIAAVGASDFLLEHRTPYPKHYQNKLRIRILIIFVEWSHNSPRIDDAPLNHSFEILWSVARQVLKPGILH